MIIRKSSAELRGDLKSGAGAIAFGSGGLAGAVIVDLLRADAAADGPAFATVFLIEAVLFVAAAMTAVATAMVRANPRTGALET